VSYQSSLRSCAVPISGLLCVSTTQPPPHIYTLSLHDALPISLAPPRSAKRWAVCSQIELAGVDGPSAHSGSPRQRSQCPAIESRSEEHTSELQSPDHLVCRLLLEKKNKRSTHDIRRSDRLSRE